MIMTINMPTTILGFLSFVFLVVNEINCFQRFAEQPMYTEVNPGQDAFLTCKIIDKRGTCSWQKDNKPVGIYPKKYEWSGSSMTLHQSMQPPHIGGDCSLWIRSATLDFDDGLWECQVTASDFTTQDALTSQPVRLVVRVAPQRPRLEHEGIHVPPGHNVTVDSGAVATVKCISHYGNPPALLKWFLGEQEISPLHPQTNATEPDNPRTWSAASVVQIPATRERHGEMLKCLALHESYAAKSVAVEARMDIKYAPTIRLLGAPQIDLEEGKDVLILRCEADANPPANIVWRRAGRSEIASLQESLQLRPVGRRDAGLYTCQAQNSVGTSEQLSIQLDVKYPPRILSAGPDRLTTAPLFSPAAFECVAEGNPSPTFKWVQRISQGSAFLERGRESRLVIDNVTYDFQGEYECRATNFINGQERTVTSEPVSLQVVGAPQVLRLNPSMHSVSVKKGESASLSLVVCADPRPRHVAWEWGSLRLEAGAGIGRYRVDEVTQDSREDCYLATLHINDAMNDDARPYYLVVENERGTDRHAIHLSVEEPLELSYLLGIAGGCVAAVLILICLCIYAVKGKKCCFKSRSGYKSSDKDSEKADLKSRSDSTSGPQGDSIYTTPAGFHHHHHHSGQGSPEAMKSTTTLLQNGLLLERSKKQHSMQPYQLHQLQSRPGTLQRQQRDLFTGDLGIPEISTRVGHVIHAFETMAMLRRDAEKPYDEIDSGEDRNLRGVHADTGSGTTTGGRGKSSKASATYRSSSSRHGGSHSKYSQMKRKSNESRQKIALAATLSKSLANTLRSDKYHPIYSTIGTNASAKRIPGGGRDNPGSTPHHYYRLDTNGHVSQIDTLRHLNKTELGTSAYHINDDDNYGCGGCGGRDDDDDAAATTLDIGDDYRKNLFGTQPSRKRRSKTYLPGVNKYQTNTNTINIPIDIGDDIINRAFSGIFDNEDEYENDRKIQQPRNTTFSFSPRGKTAGKTQTFHLPPQRSATLTDIFEFTKPKNQFMSKYPSTSSTTALNNDATKIDFNYKSKSKKSQQPYHSHHQQNTKKQPSDDPNSFSDDNENFLRGSTVSQSFIKNVKNPPTSGVAASAAAADGVLGSISGYVDGIGISPGQIPSIYHHAGGISSASNISAPNSNYQRERDEHFVTRSDQKKQRQKLNNQQKRSKSSTEIVDELQRKYYHDSQLTASSITTDGGGGLRSSSSRKNIFKPRTIDRAEI